MTWQVALRLGRVSNLPTVWTNTLAALLLAGGTVADGRTVPLLLAMSLAYVGGMYLNDAFDARIDAIERPERPIPSGAISAHAVFAAGFGIAPRSAGAINQLLERRLGEQMLLEEADRLVDRLQEAIRLGL